MSNPSRYNDQGSIPTDASDAQRGETRLYDRLDELLVTRVQMLGFWSAISLPFLYVPLLVSGLDSTEMTGAFLALLAMNLVALLVGYPYKRG